MNEMGSPLSVRQIRDDVLQCRLIEIEKIDRRNLDRNRGQMENQSGKKYFIHLEDRWKSSIFQANEEKMNEKKMLFRTFF